MKLAGLQQSVPSSGPAAKGSLDVVHHDHHRESIEEAEHETDDMLCISEAKERNERSRHSSQENRSHEGPGHSTWKGEVIVCAAQPLVDVGDGQSVDEHIVSCLDVERLLHLGIRRNPEMEDNEKRNEDARDIQIWRLY